MSDYSVQRFRDGFAIVWWEESEDGPKRRRHQLSATDRQSAKEEARNRWEAGSRDPWTVGRIVSAYIATLSGRPSHARGLDAWKAMAPFWDDVDPDKITESMCRRYRETRRVGNATARYELTLLSAGLNWATKNEHISSRKAVWAPQPPPHRTRHLTRAEFASFLKAVRAPHARLYCMLGIYTLARPSSILDLTWDRVDFMRGQINFIADGKAQTAKRRPVVALGPILLAELQRAYAARTSVYVIERAGEKVGSVKKAFQAASERSNVHATPYTLRHTGAVWAAEGGISMDELAQFMGHDDSRTTAKHYARYSPEYLKGVVSAIEGPLLVAGGSK